MTIGAYLRLKDNRIRAPKGYTLHTITLYLKNFRKIKICSGSFLYSSVIHLFRLSIEMVKIFLKNNAAKLRPCISNGHKHTKRPNSGDNSSNPYIVTEHAMAGRKNQLFAHRMPRHICYCSCFLRR